MSPDVFNAKTVTKKTAPAAKQSRPNVPPHNLKSRSPREYSTVLAAEPACRNGWAAYAPLPEHVVFESQGDNEKVLMFLRQHPIVNIPWIIIAVVMVFAPFFFFPLFLRFVPLPPNYIFVSWLGWYLITAGFVIERTLMWLFNSFIITDERMIDIDFASLINKEVDYAQLDKIQEISVKTGGVLHSVVDIGSVFVQTAAESPEFVFDNVAHPSRVAKLLDELVEEEQQEFIEGRVR